MANKLYEETNISAIADAIRAKGVSGTMTVAQMSAKVAAIPTKETVTWHQCPEAVRNYLANVTYNPSDYTTSQIQNYAPIPVNNANTIPIGKTVDGVTYKNNVPNIATPFSSTNTAGTVKPLDFLRWIDAGEYGGNRFAYNLRDLGGWSCDGGTVKYGMLIRGSSPTASARRVIVEELGFHSEIELRGTDEAGNPTASVMGTDVDYYCTSDYAWYSLTKVNVWREILGFIFGHINKGNPVYFHCGVGRDRTGTVAYVLETLLGMSQSDMDKDYELTSFSSEPFSTTPATIRRDTGGIAGLVSQINALAKGNTFRDKLINWVVDIGFTVDDINRFRSAMINGTAGDITSVVQYTNYSVTNSLTHITNDNAAASVRSGQPYKATLTPDNNYFIKTTTLTQGGANILPDSYQQFSYPVECGKIYIPNVSGNIVITAMAEEKPATYTNQIPISTTRDSSAIFNGTGYKASTRLRSSGAEGALSTPSAPHPAFVTGMIPVNDGDVIRFKHCWIDADGTSAEYGESYGGLYFYCMTANKASGGACNHWGSMTGSASTSIAKVGTVVTDASGNVIQFTFNGSYGSLADIKFVQFTIAPETTPDQAIITVNEPIV